MKHFLLSLTFVFIGITGYAQCEPATDFGDEPFGVSPDTIVNFAPALINTLYTQQIDVKVPSDGGFLGALFAIATIDSATIVSISGLPEGLSYECQDLLSTPCTFPGGATGCGVVSGIPNEAGEYELEVLLLIYASLPPPLQPTSVPFPVEGYRIVVGDPLSTSFNTSAIGMAPVFPNPTQREARLVLNAEQAGTGTIQVFDLVGKLVMQDTWALAPGENTRTLDMGQLREGVYVARVEAFGDRASAKIVVSR